MEVTEIQQRMSAGAARRILSLLYPAKIRGQRKTIWPGQRRRDISQLQGGKGAAAPLKRL